MECGWRRGAEVVLILILVLVLVMDDERRTASGEEREEPICRIARSGGLRLYLLVIRVVPQPYSVSLHIPYSISRIPYPHHDDLLHTYVSTFLHPHYSLSRTFFLLLFHVRFLFPSAHMPFPFVLFASDPSFTHHKSKSLASHLPILESRDSRLSRQRIPQSIPRASGLGSSISISAHDPATLRPPLVSCSCPVSRVRVRVHISASVSVSSRLTSRLSSTIYHRPTHPSLSLGLSLSPVCSPHIPES